MRTIGGRGCQKQNGWDRPRPDPSSPRRRVFRETSHPGSGPTALCVAVRTRPAFSVDTGDRDRYLSIEPSRSYHFSGNKAQPPILTSRGPHRPSECFGLVATRRPEALLRPTHVEGIPAPETPVGKANGHGASRGTRRAANRLSGNHPTNDDRNLEGEDDGQGDEE